MDTTTTPSTDPGHLQFQLIEHEKHDKKDDGPGLLLPYVEDRSRVAGVGNVVPVDATDLL